MDDVLISFGGEIKSLGDGKIGGVLVRFSSDADPDLAGDFFTKETDFGIEDGQKTAIYLNHRQPLKTKKGKAVAVRERIGTGTLKVTDEGVLIEAILDEHDKYKGVLGSLGWSSGTAAHLADREKHGKAFHVKSWPLGLDASLTPRPCEPRNCLVPLKSLADELFGEETKNVLDDELSKEVEQVWRIWSAFNKIVEKSARTAADASVTGVEFDYESKIREAAYALPDKLVAASLPQVDDFIKSPEREHFYLKQFYAPESLVSEGLDSHSSAVVSAVEGFANEASAVAGAVKVWAKRVSDKQEFRAGDPLKSGRVISQANRDRIAEVMGRLDELMPVLKDMHASLSELHTLAGPKTEKSADPDLLRGLIAEFEMTRRTLTRRL